MARKSCSQTILLYVNKLTVLLVNLTLRINVKLKVKGTKLIALHWTVKPRVHNYVS